MYITQGKKVLVVRQKGNLFNFLILPDVPLSKTRIWLLSIPVAVLLDRSAETTFYINWIFFVAKLLFLKEL